MSQNDTVGLMAALIYVSRWGRNPQGVTDVLSWDYVAKEAWQLYYAVEDAEPEASARRFKDNQSR